MMEELQPRLGCDHVMGNLSVGDIVQAKNCMEEGCIGHYPGVEGRTFEILAISQTHKNTLLHFIYIREVGQTTGRKKVPGCCFEKVES